MSFLLQDDGVSRFLLDDDVSRLILDDENDDCPLLLESGDTLLLISGEFLVIEDCAGTTAITRWHMRPGGKSMSWTPIASISDEPIVVIVKGDDFQGGVVVASSASARMAVVLPDIHPQSADWNTTTWKTDSTTNPATYRALGPSPLDLSLTDGLDYVVWMELTDIAGVTTKPVSGLLSII